MLQLTIGVIVVLLAQLSSKALLSVWQMEFFCTGSYAENGVDGRCSVKAFDRQFVTQNLQQSDVVDIYDRSCFQRGKERLPACRVGVGIVVQRSSFLIVNEIIVAICGFGAKAKL